MAVISITGKGGVGKTTLAAAVVHRLTARAFGPVLALDADPNSCLDAALGVAAVKTVGRVREEARAAAGQSAGIDKQRFLEMKIAECVVESQGFDLIAMGRSEGPGCYCYANNVVRDVLARLGGAYPYVVLDNEAGLENLSRRIARSVDLMVMVTDASRQGLRTVERLHELTKEMQLAFRRLALVVNRAPGAEMRPAFAALGAAVGADPVCVIPFGNDVASLAEEGGPVTGLHEGNALFTAADDLIDCVPAGWGGP